MRRFVLGLVIAATIATSPLAWGKQAPEDYKALVGQRLADLDRWLAAYGQQGWNAYLKNDALRGQLSAPTADPVILSQILSQYRSPQKGLDDPHFAAVRIALQRWIASDKNYEQQLPQLVQQAQFQPIGEAQINEARVALARELAALKPYLGSGQNGENWQAFLQLADLQAAAAEGAKPDVAKLDAIQEQFESGQPGLEQRPFVRVSQALRRYRDTLATAQDAELPNQFRATVEQVASLLKERAANPSVDLHPLLGAVAWLQQNNQASQAVQAIQNRFALRNIYLRVSGKALAATSSQRTSETIPISTAQNGTYVRGTAYTSGDITARLIPSQTAAIWDARFLGSTVSRATASQRSALVGLKGVTSLDGYKRIYLYPTGVTAGPAAASACTDMNITCIGSTAGGLRGCIVERVASRRAPQQLPEAEQSQSQQAEARLRERLEKQGGQQVADANRSFWEKFRQPLTEKGEFPSDLSFQSTKDYLIMTGAFGGPAGLAAPSIPPSFSGDPDISARIHETAVNNLAEGMYAGETLQSENVRESMLNTLGAAPKADEDEEDREPWSITFADANPVEVRFPDGGAKITVRGKRYTSGDRRYRAMNVTATYRFEQTPEGLKAVRQGDLEIFPPGFVPGQRQLSVAEQTLRRMLQRRMGKILAPELGGNNIQLSGKLEKAGPMDTTQLASQGGWLTVGLTQKTKPAPVQTAMKQ